MIRPAAALLMTLINLPVAAKTVFIAPSGNDARSGLTAADAMPTLKNAQSRAVAGDKIEIAGGNYPWVEGTVSGANSRVG